MTWINAHWPMLAATLGPALGVLLATIVNIYSDPDHDPATPPPPWVVPFIVLKNLLAARAGEGRKGIDGIGDGRWSVPLLHYPKAGAPVPARNGVPPGASGMVPLLAVLCLAGALTACNFGACLLGKVKASQSVVVDVTSALVVANWESALAALAVSAGGDLVDCTVQAIVTYQQQKQAAMAKAMADAPPGRLLAAAPDLLIEHGIAWLKKHPARACLPTTPVYRRALAHGMRMASLDGPR